MTQQELEQLKQRVIAEHNMGSNKNNPRVTVGMGSCGIKAGAGMVLDALRQELGANTEAVVTHVGCIGLCAFEPVVEVALPGQPVTVYGRMTPEKAIKVVREHVLGGKPVQELVLALRDE